MLLVLYPILWYSMSRERERERERISPAQLVTAVEEWVVHIKTPSRLNHDQTPCGDLLSPPGLSLQTKLNYTRPDREKKELRITYLEGL